MIVRTFEPRPFWNLTHLTACGLKKHDILRQRRKLESNQPDINCTETMFASNPSVRAKVGLVCGREWSL